MTVRRRAPRRWSAMRSPLGAIAGALVLLVGATAVVAPMLWNARANKIDTDALSRGPSGSHIFGTDSLGRDIFFRLLVATRLSVELALTATVIGVVAGVALGAGAVVLGRRARRLVTAVVNIAVAFPSLLLILFFAVIFGVSTRGAVLALAVAMAPFFARLTQTLAASVVGREFVAAAKVAGVGRVRILFRHVLPNIGEQLAINATIAAGSALLSFAGLSFLGIGVQPPSYDWGRLLNEGLLAIYVNPAGALAPAAAVVIAGLAFNLLGEAASQAVAAPSGGRRAARSGPPQIEAVSASATPAVGSPDGEPSLLVVENLSVSFPMRGTWTAAVRGVGFTLSSGDALGLVGESGSGKSVTALAIAQLIEPPAVVSADRLDFRSSSLLAGASRRQRRMLGTSLAMVFQDPMTSLNPALRVGTQLAEVSMQHDGMRRRPAIDKAVSVLQSVRVQAARRRVRQYPHEFSGGMRQRVMIAMGLMGQPRLIIADEPTTALDVTVQQQVLALLNEVRGREGAAMLLISHDLSVVAQHCERVIVMYAGRIVEDLPVVELPDASHPYTRALLAAAPDMTTPTDRPLTVIPGRPPEPDQLTIGCPFAPRCTFADDRCHEEEPELAQLGGSRRVACWHPREPLPTAERATTDGAEATL